MKFKKLFTRKHYSIGVCFKGQALQLLELCSSKGLLSVSRYIKLDAFSVRGNDFKTKIANATIPAVNVIKKRVIFSSVLNNDDIKTELKVNQSDYFPGISDQLVFDFNIMTPQISQGDNQEVMIFAARAEEIEQYQEKIKQFGLELNFLEPENIALLRTVFYCHKQFKEKAYYAALFFIQHQYRLIIFSKDAVLHEELQTSIHDPWNEEDIPLICNMLKDTNHLLQAGTVNGFFLVSHKNISSEFISKLSKQQQLSIKVISPFQQINDEMGDSDALLVFGSALRGFP